MALSMKRKEKKECPISDSSTVSSLEFDTLFTDGPPPLPLLSPRIETLTQFISPAAPQGGISTKISRKIAGVDSRNWLFFFLHITGILKFLLSFV